MIIILAIGGALLGAAAFAKSRQAEAPPPAAEGGGVPAELPPAAPPRQEPVKPPKPPDGGGSPGLDLGNVGAGGVLAAAGIAAGAIAGASAFTKDAKDVAVPVGIGVAAATYLALSSGATVIGVTGAAAAGAAAGGYLIVPVILVTVAIVTIVDGIARAVRVGEWVDLVKKVGELRAQGKFREAIVLWRKKLPEIPEISRVWPQPGNPALGQPADSWYNAADPLGRPWAGFPVEPAPATAADVARWPELVPTHVATRDGDEIAIAGLFDSLQKDVREVRDWGLKNKVPGRIVGAGGKGLSVGLVTVTEGDRDLRGWPPYDTARSNLSSWSAAIAAATPWLSSGALEGYALILTPAERAVANAGKTIAAEKKIASTAAVISRTTGMTRAEATVVAIEARQETTAARAETTAARTQGTGTTGGTRPRSGSSGETDAGGARTGRTPTNNSGSGGRNA